MIRRCDVSRRTFLTLATLAGGTAAAATACSSGTPVSPEAFGDVSAGTASALMDPSLVAVAGQPVCIGRDANGVYAMTLTCTHMGCTVGIVDPTRLSCPCHGSSFDGDGNVTGGPAPAPLQHFAVTADASGNLTIHGDQEVSETTRLTGV